MAKTPRQPVVAATILAAAAPATVLAAAAPATSEVAPVSPMTDQPVQDDQSGGQAASAPATLIPAQPAQGDHNEGQAADEVFEGRVILAFDEYKPNDVFSGSADDVDALERARKIDCDPKAIAYAKSLGVA